MSKGSARRPGEGYEEAWEQIFGKKVKCSEPFCNCEPGKCERKEKEDEPDNN